MFVDLLASNGVREELELAAPVGVMALHGGLEAGTAELAWAVAATTGASRYAVIQPDDLRWHIPSVRYDPGHSDQLARFVDRVDIVVSLHGFGRRGLERTVLIGGGNRQLAAELAEAIASVTTLDVLDDLDAIPPALRGMHPANPVNLPVGGGAQIELPSAGRRAADLAALETAIGRVVLERLHRQK